MAYGDDVYRICRRGSFLHRLFCLQWFLPPGTGLTAATYIPQYNAVRTSVHFSRMRFLGSRTRDPGDGTDTLLPPVGPCPLRARGRTAWRTRPTRAVHPRARDSHCFRLSYAVSGVQNARSRGWHRHPLTSGRRIGISGRRPSFPLMVRASHTGCEQSRPRPPLNRTSGPCAATVVLGRRGRLDSTSALPVPARRPGVISVIRVSRT